MILSHVKTQIEDQKQLQKALVHWHGDNNPGNIGFNDNAKAELLLMLTSGHEKVRRHSSTQA
jgi:hypothetical protein